MRKNHLMERRAQKITLNIRNPQQVAPSDKHTPPHGQRPNQQQDIQKEINRAQNCPPNMERLPKRQPARDEKLVWENGGFSGYSTEETTGPEPMIPGPPGASPTQSHTRPVRKSISYGCHIELVVSKT